MPSAGTARSNRLRVPLAERELAAGLRSNELVLHYQPIVSLSTGAIRGVEALVRWYLPDGRVLLPDSFLPAIEDTPAMHLLTTWVVEQACAQAARWAPWTVSVNIAAVDVGRSSLVDLVEESLRTNDVPPDRLTVELTERAAVEGLQPAGAVLESLRNLGVGVALDDFGTGYSSLLYLRDLPVTEVKVDRTFVNGVDRSEDDAAIVDSIVRLARSVGKTVVAEGVETAAQASYLHGIGCGLAQGFRYAHPTPAHEVPRMLNPSLFQTQPGARRRRAPRRAMPVPPQAVEKIRSLMAAGASLHTIAAALNRDGLVTEAGLRWTGTTVARAVNDLSPGVDETAT